MMMMTMMMMMTRTMMIFVSDWQELGSKAVCRQLDKSRITLKISSFLCPPWFSFNLLNFTHLVSFSKMLFFEEKQDTLHFDAAKSTFFVRALR